MAERARKPPAPPRLERRAVEELMFGSGRVRRFTQDSPVLPDVWLAYAGLGAAGQAPPGATPDRFPTRKLLLAPARNATAGDARRELVERLARERETSEWRAFRHDPEHLGRVVYNQTTVAATLYFEDLIRAVLPMTDWWAELERQWKIEGIRRRDVQTQFARAIQDPQHAPPLATGRAEKPLLRLPPALLWMMRIAGALAIVHRGRSLPRGFFGPQGVDGAGPGDWLRIVAAIADLIDGIESPPRPVLHSVSLNRDAAPTVSRSSLAIKADAARLLFAISCRDLSWAIVDSGVDARHAAFRQRKKPVHGEAEMVSLQPFRDAEGNRANCSRVEATYDFTQIELLLDASTDEYPEVLKKRLQKRTKESAALRRELKELETALTSGRSLDWKLIAPFLRVPHDETYSPPGLDHGTHVAGILAGNWRGVESDGSLEEDLVGICPDLRLYDLRVLDAQGRGDEFTVMAALQFIRHLNSSNDFVAVHGANLSLSIPHDVSNYACGRTPVCEECERLVSSGVVVVAAAGNQGFRRYQTDQGDTEAYNSISITDPGNAELVITVGATHRYRPHVYGVSYFSSRGPTGDGRSKPDLVAPGEKITAPLPDGSFGLKDGTSMAAPHVSGAAALLMARHSELVGLPARIKQILCSTATDLGRERYFQGAGMLDVLRALQSV